MPNGWVRSACPWRTQPVELQPIVRSFNTLLDRLSAGREREREFVDGVAHELRTPITLISGFAQRLQRQGWNANVIAIEREARRMTRLVADLLDIARDEAGRLEMRPGPVRPR
jgi:two-component system OmpR family sensor kinase